MKRTNELQGRRVPDWTFTSASNEPALEPGDYRKVLDYPLEIPTSNLTGTVWSIRTPNGLLGYLTAHTVREEDDGSISVAPGDGSSNSILVQQGAVKSWHGYITRGLWWSLA